MSDTDIAVAVVMAAWTWRYDDPTDRTRDALTPIATADVVDQLAPTPTESARRAADAEVSWAIIRNVDTDNSSVTVTFDHHLVTTASPETVTRRLAMVMVDDGRAVDVATV